VVLNSIIFNVKPNTQALNFYVSEGVLNKLELSLFVMSNNFVKVTLANSFSYFNKLICLILIIGKLNVCHTFVVFNTKVLIVLLKNDVMQDFKLDIPDFASIGSATHTIIAVVKVISIQTIILFNQITTASIVGINTITYSIVLTIT
jgi:hypothetical protein